MILGYLAFQVEVPGVLGITPISRWSIVNCHVELTLTRARRSQHEDPDPEDPVQLATVYFPEGPSTQYLRTLVPKTIALMVFGTRVLKYWVLGPSGFDSP